MAAGAVAGVHSNCRARELPRKRFMGMKEGEPGIPPGGESDTPRFNDGRPVIVYTPELSPP
eukprot:9327199-Pyramimonas_sp.AAC.1